MKALLSALKALCGCAAAMVLLVVFIVLDRFVHFQTEGDPWYE